MNDYNCERPIVGFIVEGHGEYNCYPSLAARSTNTGICYFPVVNAGSCSTIIKRLDEQLTDLVIYRNPVNIIITVDLVDVLKQKLANNLNNLVSIINISCREWLEASRSDKRFSDLPEKIIFVAQIKKFESWLISDIEGLQMQGLLDDDADIFSFDDAELIEKPCKWLRDNLRLGGDIKKPATAKRITSALRPEIMIKKSKSFSRFYHELNKLLDG